MSQSFQDVLRSATSRSEIYGCGEKIIRRGILRAFGTDCRLLEIEFYLHSVSHPDPFTHCHALQQQFGHWYIHRVGKGYKNGSFKGLDLTFGNISLSGDTFGGVLIRSIQAADGQVICGPSLCVDYLIQAGDFDSVQELDQAICEMQIWDQANPLRLVLAEDSQEEIFRTSRVGLSLAAMDREKDARDYITRRYRFLSSPRQVKKGRVQLILAMHQDGDTVEGISKKTGSPKTTIEKYVNWFDNADDTDTKSLADSGAMGICLREAVFGNST